MYLVFEKVDQAGEQGTKSTVSSVKDHHEFQTIIKAATLAKMPAKIEALAAPFSSVSKILKNDIGTHTCILTKKMSVC